MSWDPPSSAPHTLFARTDEFAGVAPPIDPEAASRTERALKESQNAGAGYIVASLASFFAGVALEHWIPLVFGLFFFIACLVVRRRARRRVNVRLDAVTKETVTASHRRTRLIMLGIVLIGAIRIAIGFAASGG